MKVAIGRANDPYEREADAVAARVSVGLPAPAVSTLPAGGLKSAQRKEADERAEPLQRQTDESPADKKEEEPATDAMPVQRAASGSARPEDDEEKPPPVVPPKKHEEQPEQQPGRTALVQRAADDSEEPAEQEEEEEKESPVQEAPSGPAARPTPSMAAAAAHAISSKGPGEPIRADTRHSLESRMGVDLGDVRVHEGAAAQESAGALHARAFTHGRDIWLGRGESQRSVPLMAHETTHVLQQNAVVRRKPAGEEGADDDREDKEKEKEEEAPGAGGAAARPMPPAAREREPREGGAPEAEPRRPVPAEAPHVAAPGAAPVEARTPGAPAPATPPGAPVVGQPAPTKEEAPAEAKPEGGAGTEPTPPVAVAPAAAEAAEKPAPAETAPKPELGGAGAAGAGPPTSAPKPGEAEGAPPPVEVKPEADPRYQAVMARVEKTAKASRAHEPAAKKVASARAAAEPPGNDRASRAQANQVDVMAAQEPKKPEPATFIDLLRAKLREIAPGNMEETEKFKKEGKAGQLKTSLTAEVDAQKEASSNDIKKATSAEPNPESVEPKDVTPLPPEPADPKAPALKSEEVLPEPKPAGDVSVKANKDEADRVMAENDIDEQQLRDANEPQCTAAVEAKSQLDAHADSVPETYRAEEQSQLGGAKAELTAEEKAAKAELKVTREQRKKDVSGKQAEAKKREEEERKRVADTVEGIYQRTRKSVEDKLSALDGEVDGLFDQGEKAARDRFESYVDRRMSDYKWDRYISQVGGSLLWAKDKLFGMPDEVNVFYAEGRDQYIADMDVVLVQIATKVEQRVKEAKDEIARGREEIRKYVSELPKNLQKAGEDAEKGVSEKFTDLEGSVEAKKNDLVDKLAARAKEAREKLDDRIKELKAANQGLLDAFVAKLREIAEILKNFKEKVTSLFEEGAGVVRKIIKKPIAFLKNLLAAVKLGFNQFKDHILDHLKKGILGWLFGALSGAGIEIPSEFSIKAIFGVVMQILGLTKERLRAKVEKLIGAKNVERIETAWEWVSTLIKEGPAGLWEKVKEFLADLKETVINGIRDWVVTAIVKAAVVWLVSLFNPVSALFKAIKAIYDVVMFFVERIDQILDVVRSIIKSVGKIVAGQIGDAANWVEKTMSNTVPVVISFLAALLGLGGISDKIRTIIAKLQDRVDKVIDKVLAKIIAPLKKLVAKGKAAAKKAIAKGKAAAKKGYEKVKGFLFPKKKFAAGQESHTIWVDSRKSPPRPMISTTPADIDAFLKSAPARTGVAGNETKIKRIEVARVKVGQMQTFVKEVEQAANAHDAAKTADLNQKVAALEEDIARDLNFILSGTSSSEKDEEKYRLEGMVATYGTMPRMKDDKLTPDHEPQKAVLQVVGSLPEFVGTRAATVGKASGVPEGICLNVYHKRHVAGRTYGGKGSAEKARFTTKLTSALAAIPASETVKRKDKAIDLVKDELVADTDEMTKVYDNTTADHYSDVVATPGLPEKIRDRGKAGVSRIRSQNLEALKQ